SAGGRPSSSTGALATGAVPDAHRDQAAPTGELGADQEGRLVPLRPVSELGLVDLTDVPDRQASASAADTPKPAAAAKTRSAGAAKRQNRSKSSTASTAKAAGKAPAP